MSEILSKIEHALLIRDRGLPDLQLEVIRGFKLLADVIDGVKFIDGEKQVTEEADNEDRILA